MIAARRGDAVAETVRRRWRLTVLMGLMALVGMAGYALVVTILGAENGRAVSVLKAARDIQAGSTIASDDLATTPVRIDDPTAMSSLVAASERNRLVGQVATASVPAGHLVPASLTVSQSASELWGVPLPVKRMPPDLKPGDHVAVMVMGTTKTGDAVDFVVMQDVQVLAVRSDSANLWLPARSMAQMEWYADHGGVVLAKMPPGVVQQSLPEGSQG